MKNTHTKAAKTTTMSNKDNKKKNVWEDLNRLSEEELKRYKGN